jgi:hypothetical protein
MTDKLNVTVVPRTICRDDSKREVRISATLVLRPETIRPTNDTLDSELFEKWPSIIHALFKRNAVTAELGLADKAGRLKTDVTKAIAAPWSRTGYSIESTRLTTTPDLPAIDAAFAKLKKDITEIWCELLEDSGSTGAMTGLRAALLDAAAGSDVNPDEDHPYNDVQQKPAPPPGDPDAIAPPNIVGMPRTELAQQITMARALAMVARVKGRAPSRQAFLGEGAYFQRPWARSATAMERLALESAKRRPKTTDVAGYTPDRTPIIFAADATPADAQRDKLSFNPFRYYNKYVGPTPSDTDDMQWSKISDALVTQRSDKDEIYKGTLREHQDLARDIHNAELDLQGNPQRSLRTIGAKRSKHDTLYDSIGALGKNNGTVDCKFLHLHDAATLEDYGKAPDSNSHTGKEADQDNSECADDARRRWFALLGYTSLQRLFLLSVEAELVFPTDAFDALIDEATATKDFVLAERPAAFFLVRLCVNAADPVLQHVECSRQPWTLAKAPWLAKAPQSLHPQPEAFWPATLEELLECSLDGDAPRSALDLRQRGTIDQFDGVLDLEAAAVSNDHLSLRFSIETVDIHAAAESDMRRDAAMANAADLRATDGTPLPPIAELTAGAAVERKLRTAGLQLLDQWRGSVVVKQFSRSLSRFGANGEALILDADDLAVGYRLDVGFWKGENSDRTWACLNNRKVTYALPHGDALDGAIDAVLGESGAAARKMRTELDGSVLAMPTRLLQNADGNKTGFAESVLAVWQGDPLGLEAYEQRVNVYQGGLALNVDFNLLSDENDELPPKLRFGVPYWLGARTVFLGGVCLPLRDATQRDALTLYENGLCGGMLLPGREQLRRFLRHEWIDPPMVAVPWGDIVNELQVKPPQQFCRGLDGETMVVRMPTPYANQPEEDDDTWRFKPMKSQRAVCAPGVDFTFAHLHGVFDADKIDPTKKFGLTGVDYDLSRGGFPSISPQAAITEDAIVYKRITCNQPPASGIAIFRPRKCAPATRAEELYYPDPAARSLVIGLRYPWTTDTYLADAPIVIPLYGGGTSGLPRRDYPDAVPVLITVEAVAGKDGRLTSHKQLERRADGKLTKVVAIETGKPATAHNAAIELTIRLAPAEDFCVDVWALPDLGQLAQWFDAPESVAFFCAATQHGDTPDPVAEKRILSDAMPVKISYKPDRLPPHVFRRNDAVVTSVAVARAAEGLHATLRSKPVPELSAVRSLRAVHAVEQPPAPPQLVATDGKRPEVRFLRVDEHKRGEIMRSPPNDWHKWRRTEDSPAATDVVAGGDIRIDRALHESIELRVQAVAPNGRPIDNPLLGRTPEDVLRGLYPKEPNPRSFKDKSVSPSRRLYGFDVDEDGCVTFRPEEIVFNKWTPQPKPELTDQPLSLVELTAESERPAPVTAQQQGTAPAPPSSTAQATDVQAPQNAGNGRRSAQNYFSDGTARRVKTYFAATSRTARLIPERSTYPDETQQKNDKKRLYAYIKDAGDQPIMTSAIIRSIVRPLALPPKHVLPAFVWTTGLDALTGVQSVSRRTRIRIPFDRPAMTSGEDERVGIVLWPPNILGAATGPRTGPLPTWTEADLAVGKIRRAEPLETDEPQNKLIDLQNLGQQDLRAGTADWRPPYFSDEDLGPGGPYITRWGADAIHAAGDLTWFMHPRAFRDQNDWRATALDTIAAEGEDSGMLWPEENRYTPRLVENVLMPIPGDDPSKSDPTSGGADKNGAGEANDQQPDFMLVSLLTYAPRFEVDSQTWYVDVEIDPGTAPDPFLRLGLVRFQPHANRRIQVSYPVAEWIQVVGYCRDVTIERDDNTVTVNVKGPVLADNTSEAPLAIIRASLIERRISEYGVAYERPARPVTDGKLGDPIEQVSYANAQSDDLIWQGIFSLPAKDDSDDKVTYAIYIEECYRMRRATFDQEPVRDEPPATERDDPAYWRDSGPRFAVRIDL